MKKGAKSEVMMSLNNRFTDVWQRQGEHTLRVNGGEGHGGRAFDSAPGLTSALAAATMATTPAKRIGQPIDRMPTRPSSVIDAPATASAGARRGAERTTP